MKFLDFEYDGLHLSDFGFIACQFEASSGMQTMSAGSKITFSKVARDRGRRNSLVGTKYQDCLTCTFDICKNPDEYPDPLDMYIKNDEYRDIMRWLNRREFCVFRAIPEECEEDDNIVTCKFNASFNIEKIKASEDLIGLRLTMETDRPFGFGDEIIKTMTFGQTTSYSVYDPSDEIGEFYPDLTITMSASGDLIISNETLDVTMSVNNCSVGEVITIKGSEQIITTSIPEHDICNDFNYEFLRIGNTYHNRSNKITCDVACTVKLSFCPVIKDTP